MRKRSRPELRRGRSGRNPPHVHRRAGRCAPRKSAALKRLNSDARYAVEGRSPQRLPGGWNNLKSGYACVRRCWHRRPTSRSIRSGRWKSTATSGSRKSSTIRRLSSRRSKSIYRPRPTPAAQIGPASWKKEIRFSSAGSSPAALRPARKPPICRASFGCGQHSATARGPSSAWPLTTRESFGPHLIGCDLSNSRGINPSRGMCRF